MIEKETALRGLVAAATLAVAALAPTHAAVTLPGGDTFGDGSFTGMDYGATGEIVQITPWLYTGALGPVPFDATESPTQTAATTGLTYGYSVAGLGTGLTVITYELGNTGPATATDLSFIVHANPDGSGSFVDHATTVPAPWPAAAAGDPDQFQIADWLENAFSFNGTNERLDGTDTCGGTCDVELALQWNLAALPPGMLWQIDVGLSDDGQALSSRYLEVESADTANTTLTFSGTATVVPLPASAMLLGSALIGLLGLRGKKKAQR